MKPPGGSTSNATIPFFEKQVEPQKGEKALDGEVCREITRIFLYPRSCDGRDAPSSHAELYTFSTADVLLR